VVHFQFNVYSVRNRFVSFMIEKGMLNTLHSRGDEREREVRSGAGRKNEKLRRRLSALRGVLKGIDSELKNRHHHLSDVQSELLQRRSEVKLALGQKEDRLRPHEKNGREREHKRKHVKKSPQSFTGQEVPTVTPDHGRDLLGGLEVDPAGGQNTYRSFQEFSQKYWNVQDDEDMRRRLDTLEEWCAERGVKL